MAFERMRVAGRSPRARCEATPRALPLTDTDPEDTARDAANITARVRVDGGAREMSSKSRIFVRDSKPQNLFFVHTIARAGGRPP